MPNTFNMSGIWGLAPPIKDKFMSIPSGSFGHPSLKKHSFCSELTCPFNGHQGATQGQFSIGPNNTNSCVSQNYCRTITPTGPSATALTHPNTIHTSSPGRGISSEDP